MIVSDFTKRELLLRRANRAMEANGYERISGPWTMFSGVRGGHKIIDAVIDATGRNVWVKCVEARANG